LEMFRNHIQASQRSVTKVHKLTALYNICGGCSGDRWAASKPIPDPAGPGHLVGAAGMMGGGGVLGWEVLVGRSD
jgi:hypothetical protein